MAALRDSTGTSPRPTWEPISEAVQDSATSGLGDGTPRWTRLFPRLRLSTARTGAGDPSRAWQPVVPVSEAGVTPLERLEDRARRGPPSPGVRPAQPSPQADPSDPTDPWAQTPWTEWADPIERDPFASRPRVTEVPESFPSVERGGVGSSCQEPLRSDARLTGETLGGRLCKVSFGDTLEPSIPPLRIRGRQPRPLTAAVPLDFDPPPLSEADLLEVFFPELAAARRPDRPWTVEDALEQGRGLFWRNPVTAGIDLALDLIRAFPETALVPHDAAARDCDMTADHLLAVLPNLTVISGRPPRSTLGLLWTRAEGQAVEVLPSGVVRLVQRGVRGGTLAMNWPRFFGGAQPSDDPGQVVRQRVVISDVFQLDLVYADLMFYWASRLLRWSREGDFPRPSGVFADAGRFRDLSDDRGVFDEGRSFTRASPLWYRVMAELCARSALSQLLRVAAILIHELLHAYVLYHCDGWGRDYRCCQDQVMIGCVQAFMARFGLPEQVAATTSRFDSAFDVAAGSSVPTTEGQYFRRFWEPYSIPTFEEGCAKDVEEPGVARRNTEVFVVFKPIQHCSFLRRPHAVRWTRSLEVSVPGRRPGSVINRPTAICGTLSSSGVSHQPPGHSAFPRVTGPAPGDFVCVPKPTRAPPPPWSVLEPDWPDIDAPSPLDPSESILDRAEEGG